MARQSGGYGSGIAGASRLTSARLIETVPETGSTNADLLMRLRGGESIPEGFWLHAVCQTGGRGRSGREWQSPPGNLYASTLVHLEAADPPAQTLALVAGLAVYWTVRTELGVDDPTLVLKWPNDVMVSDAKIAGILLERVQQSVVIGIGINIANAPEIPGRKAASLNQLQVEPEIEPSKVLAMLDREFWRELTFWREEGVEHLIRRWTTAAHPKGAALSVHGADNGTVSGTFEGLAPDGALRLRLPDGSSRVIHAGDVMLGDE